MDPSAKDWTGAKSSVREGSGGSNDEEVGSDRGEQENIQETGQTENGIERPVLLIATSAAALSPPEISRVSSTSSLSARRRVSSLGTGSSDDLVASQHPPLRMRHQSSPLTSPTFHNIKTFDIGQSSGSGLAPPSYQSTANAPSIPSPGRGLGLALDLGGTTAVPGPNHPHGIMPPRRSAATQRRRLIGFGTIVISLSCLLWFSVYQRHSIWGSLEVQSRVPISEKGPWLILALVMSFLGFAAICAGVAIKKEEDATRVRVVRGDAVLGMIADQDPESSVDYSEPTSPQRAWAMKALSEVSDRL